MTTLTACKRAAKEKLLTGGLLIAHREMFTDRRGIDRGYTLVSMKDAVDFEERFPNVTFFAPRTGKRWTSIYPLREVVAARLRTGEPVE
ncbi:MAG: hypothetical protein ACHQU0_03225 [Candidatus Paceibacteria bacterium]